MTAAAAGPPFAGFPATSRGAAFNGVTAAGSVLIGNPAGLNFDGQITMIAWVKPTLAASPRVQDILAHGYRASPGLQEVFMRINGAEYGIGSSIAPKLPNSLTPTEGTNSTGGRAAADVTDNNSAAS